MSGEPNAEQRRLMEADEQGVAWRRWGPYLSERQWGTVREDYSDNGDAWSYFTHEQARSRAYRWGEDGIAGLSDDKGRLCFALALWNGRDPILKERMFGLTNAEGNHGEDVKEYYFYLDSTPTHSYMKLLYKYPQAAYPYTDLAATNRARSRGEFEYELLDTGVFDDDRYFDVFVEYAKASPEDVLVQVTVHNRGPQEASLHLLPTLWFRHTWSWAGASPPPRLQQVPGTPGMAVIAAEHEALGRRFLYCDQEAPLLFTENETNNERIFGSPNDSPYVKDGIDRYVVHGETDAVNPAGTGTKAAAHCRLTVGAGASATVRLRLTDTELASALDGRARSVRIRIRRGPLPAPGGGRRVLRRRCRRGSSEDERRVVRQALAGMLWTQAVLLLRHRALARRARARPVGGRPAHPQQRLVPHGQRRRHLDAGQVGVPVVRGLGPGLPHDRAVAGRRRLRQGAAGPAAEPPLPAPERADPGVRVELRRRQPAGARLGDAVSSTSWKSSAPAAPTDSSWRTPSRS